MRAPASRTVASSRSRPLAAKSGEGSGAGELMGCILTGRDSEKADRLRAYSRRGTDEKLRKARKTRKRQSFHRGMAGPGSWRLLTPYGRRALKIIVRG